MNRVISYFCLGFAFFFLAGGIVGCWSRVSPAEAIDLVAVRHTAFTRTKDNFDGLIYVCNSRDYFSYYIHDGALVPDAELLDHPVVPKPLSFENFETVFVAATGWELRGVLLTAVGVTKTREKVALILGSISGFYAGRWLLSTRLPACGDAEVLAKLQDIQYWDKLKREKCKQICLRYRLWYSSVHNEPLISNVDQLKQATAALPNSTTRDQIVGYLDALNNIFHAASSSETKINEYTFVHAWVWGDYLLTDLYQNKQVLKNAFPKKTPDLAIMLDEDPEVIKREGFKSDFLTSEDYQEHQAVAVSLIIVFLFSAIVGAAFLAKQQLAKKNAEKVASA